jgi:hypothetical protein
MSAGSRTLAPRQPVARSRVSNGSDLLAGIDGRSATARRYRDIFFAIASDQGGADRMTEARLQLCRRFSALCVLAECMEAKLARGEAVDLGEMALISSTLVRLSSRIGINRIARTVVPSVADYLAHVDTAEQVDA